MMHKGTFPRANRSARKRTLVHHRAETLRAEKIGALLDPNHNRHMQYDGKSITIDLLLALCLRNMQMLWSHKHIK